MTATTQPLAHKDVTSDGAHERVGPAQAPPGPHHPSRATLPPCRVHLRHAAQWWSARSLTQQFILVAASVVLLGMAAIGSWVTAKIEQAVINNSAIAATLYMNAFVAPPVQDLAKRDEISPENRARLIALFSKPEIRQTLASIKIWRKDGEIAFSNHPDIIGRRFTPTENLKNAWNGTVSAELDGHSHEDDEAERAYGVPLLEIYAPILEEGTHRIVAVSEFYVRADDLLDALHKARLQSSALVGGTAISMILLLYAVVRRGARTIESQQQALEERARQNADLRRRVEGAYWRTDRLNEQFLRKLGAELHDGPAQLIGYALLSLDALPLDRNRESDPEIDDTLVTIRTALEDSIRDIRSLSRGLILPELDRLTLPETVSLVVRMHETRTRTAVAVQSSVLPRDVPNEVKVCTYRFIQEALNNSYKHAAGKGQRVDVRTVADNLLVSVSDDGPGAGRTGNSQPLGDSQLGLVGIRDRIETLAGKLELLPVANAGTTIRMTLDLARTAEAVQ